MDSWRGVLDGAQDPSDMDEVGMKATLDSRPVHRVYVDGFFMDKTDVTNAQFAKFVQPHGYFPIQSSSYRIVLAFRSIQLGGATPADAYAYSKTLKSYPLSEAAHPPATKFVDGRPYPLHTLPFYDIPRATGHSRHH